MDPLVVGLAIVAAALFGLWIGWKLGTRKKKVG